MDLYKFIKVCLNETYSEVCIRNIVLDAFSTQNGLKYGDALSPFLFKYVLECAIRKVQGLKLNESRRFLFSAYESTILGENINTVKENRNTQ
jgi:hypothetical protein